MSSTTVGGTVRKATAADVDAVAQTLAAAFHDDPVISWCYPDQERRRAILPRVFRLIIDATFAAGGIYTTTDRVAGAVWVPPGAVDGAAEEELATAMTAASGEYAERLLMLLEALDSKRPSAPHQYLYLLGARPEWQSRGLGSALLRPVLAACDRDGTPAYLEASSQRNVPLYRRHGFEVTEEVVLPDGPAAWLMWREPR
jgi:GNAT superfamily N-acetyltransferase